MGALLAECPFSSSVLRLVRRSTDFVICGLVPMPRVPTSSVSESAVTDYSCHRSVDVVRLASSLESMMLLCMPSLSDILVTPTPPVSPFQQRPEFALGTAFSGVADYTDLPTVECRASNEKLSR
jgi:hypothetical protein